MCIGEILVRKAVEVGGGQLKRNRTFVISENEVSFELSSQICTQDDKKYVIKRIPFICKEIHMLFQH